MTAQGPLEQAYPAPQRQRGCLRALLITSAVLAVIAVLGVVVVAIVMKVSSNRGTSGEAVDRRPSGPVSQAPPRTTVPAGTGGVEPVPTTDMLVSVARNPPVNPCSNTGPDFDLEIMGLDGGGRRRLGTEADGTEADGSAANGSVGDGLTPSDRSPDEMVNTADEELWPRLSPDRRRLVFYRSPTGKTGETCRYGVEELWMANVDGTGVHKIFSKERLARLAARSGWPSDGTLQGHADWAPDGRHVVMVLGHAPSLGPIPLLNQGETQLFVMDVDSGDLRQVTSRVDAQGRGVSSDPSFTPDGTTIVFVGCPDATPSCADMQILAVPAAAEFATETSVVLDAPGRNGNDVYVSPDGTSISWMEVGALETRLFAAEYTAGRELRPEDATLIDAHGGYANWSADSSQLIYSRLWLGDRFALFSNGFDGAPSARVSPPGSDEVFMFPSP